MITALDSNAWKRPWSDMLAPYGKTTGDRRRFEIGSLDNRDLPLPLMWQTHTDERHKSSVVVGRVLDITYTDQGALGTGDWFDPQDIPQVRQTLALVSGRVISPSIDLLPDLVADVILGEDGKPVVSYQRATIAGVTLAPIAAFAGGTMLLGPLPGEDDDEEYGSFTLTHTSSWRSMPVQRREAPFDADDAIQRILVWADGNDTRARSMFLWMDPKAAQGTRDRFLLPIGDIVAGKPALSFHAIYAAAALVSGAHGGLPSIPDSDKASLRNTISQIYQRLAGVFGDPALEAPWDKRNKMPDTRTSVTAAGAPVAPPAAWFTDPHLDQPTVPLRVEPNGRVYGHLATWESCHRSVGQLTGACLSPPHATDGYTNFMTGQVLTAENQLINVGKITAGTGHPPGPGGMNMSAAEAIGHYDNTGTCAAIVAAGEDRHGIWVSGSLTPEATEEQAAMIRRSPLSGDWRRRYGNSGDLELVAALAVVVPGFPTRRRVSMMAGERYALVASGTIQDGDTSMGDNDTTHSETDESSRPVTPETQNTTPATDPAYPPEPGPDLLQAAQVAIREVLGDLASRQRRAERLATLGALDMAERANRIQKMGSLD